ncbi:hypothetical protein [Actinomadura sp.]|jgi:hypothetical protein|uniref:hypothetical protein n=1 Tax=Actinomadura sp. TaxID=1989 RepID=UPI003354F719
MPSYDFALILSRPFYEDELDPLFDRTHGAVTVSIISEPEPADGPAAAAHRPYDEPRAADRLGNASCSWPGATLAAAIMEVVGHVEESAPGLHVLQVEADPLLTIRDIAERVGRSLDSVRHAITGARGATGFPSSEMSTAGHRLWRWSKVAAWYDLHDPQLVEAKPTVQAINGWLALRDVVPDVAPAPEDVTSALSLVIPHVA